MRCDVGRGCKVQMVGALSWDGEGEERTGRYAPQTRSYIQMYALALRTSSSVVNRTLVSLMYAHRRGASACDDGAVAFSDSDGEVPGAGAGLEVEDEGEGADGGSAV